MALFLENHLRGLDIESFQTWAIGVSPRTFLEDADSVGKESVQQGAKGSWKHFSN